MIAATVALGIIWFKIEAKVRLMFKEFKKKMLCVPFFVVV